MEREPIDSPTAELLGLYAVRHARRLKKLCRVHEGKLI
jgi:hypothetical protein